MSAPLASIPRLSRKPPRGSRARVSLGDQVADGQGHTGIVVAAGGSYVGFRTLSNPADVTVRPLIHVRRIA